MAHILLILMSDASERHGISRHRSRLPDQREAPAQAPGHAASFRSARMALIDRIAFREWAVCEPSLHAQPTRQSSMTVADGLRSCFFRSRAARFSLPVFGSADF